jgi:NAD(P)H-hydrate epimerase
MKVVSAAEMRELDRTAIEDYGIPGVVLMENAGFQVVQVIRQMLPNVENKVVCVFSGKGNNGGDGFVVARHLYNLKADVKVFLLAKTEEISGDAKINMSIWENMGRKINIIDENYSFNDLRAVLAESELVIDAIFGTGFRGIPGPPAAGVIEMINHSGKPVVAVDIPSGLQADSGLVEGLCVRAACTVTFGLPKLGLVQEPGASYTGKLHVADISIPAFLYDKETLKRQLLTKELVCGWFQPRHPAANKGDYGRALIVAGSRGMTGAACLAAMSAARAGAGLVTLAVPSGLQKLVASKLTEIMTVDLPESPEQTIGSEALDVILTLAQRFDVIAIGPGITTHPETASLVRKVLPMLKIPCVLDADGLNCFAGYTEVFKLASAPLILTPHPGEMGRLTGNTTAEIQQRRLGITEKAAREWGVVLLLKGASTIIASPDSKVYINTTGNPGMATGGAGDVLTGIIAGLIAQGLNPFDAAGAGAYLHGLAGDLAVGQKGYRGLLAGDILDFLPDAIIETESN